MSKLNRILWSGLVLVGAACGDDVTVTPPPEPPPPGIRSVTVAPDGGSVQVGGTLPMTAAVTLDPGATGAATIAWSSSDPAKATVSAAGVVTGVAVGSVGIRATATLGTSTGQGVATVNVVGAVECVINGVTVSPANASIVVGQTLALAPSVNGTNCVAADLGVTYTSGDPAIATVSASGIVTGVAGGTTTIVIKSAKDATKQAAMAVEVVVPTPATLSIQSVTQGGLAAPINLQNVGGQIEVTMNVDAGEKTLDRVDVLIGGQVVASQTFTTSPSVEAAPAATAPVPVVQSVNTRQVAQVGNLFIPVIFNGQSFITANLYVVGSSTPIASNAVPVLMNNSDGAIAPDALTDEATAAPEPFVDGASNTWFKGNLFTTINYIAFSNRTPAAATSTLDNCVDQTSTVVGDPLAGITVTNTWGCAGFEGTGTITGVGGTVWGAGVTGPDGSALRGPEIGMPGPPVVVLPGYSTVGAKFTLPGNLDRWNLITPTPNALPGPFFVDNAAPVPVVEDGVLTPGLFVAFNDLFDQQWVNAGYAFAADISATDGGTGVALLEAHDYNDGVFAPVTDGCTAAIVTTGDDYAETVTSDGTPDGERICAYAEDNLANAASTGPSNYFGVDKTMPSVRIAGSTAAIPAIGPATVPAVSPTPNTTIFSIAAPFVATDAWGVEGIDDRSGFDQANLVPGFPASENITIFNPANNPAATFNAGTLFTCGLTSPMPLILSDFWVRVAHLPGSALLDCGLGAPMYVDVALEVIDRAGNPSGAITQNYAIDQYAAPVLASVGPAAIFYTAGQPANFFLFGSDDLEIVEADLILTYGGIVTAGDPGLLTITKSLNAIAGAARWDATLTNILAGAAAIDPFFIGRIDRTCTGAGAPYASCAAADGATLAAEYNNVDTDVDALFEDDDKNPTMVGAQAYDVASQVSGVVNAGLLTAQTNDVAEQWSSDVSAAQLVSWAVVTPTGATVQAVWVTTSSTVPPYLDSAHLARIDVGGTTLVTCGAFPAPLRQDNGLQRIFTYTFTTPTTGPCAVGGLWYAVGVKGGAALVSQGQP
jgi:hypothetical protein